MTKLDPIPSPVDSQPRARGAVALSMRAGGRLGRLRQAGSLKVLFPRVDGDAEAVLVNTAGGATGGDRFETEIAAEPGARLTVTTQAAERAYRAASGMARVRNRLSVAEGARLNWLPQEMLLYDGAALDRRLSVDLAPGAELVLAETLVLGRAAMGERVRDIQLADRVALRRAGAPLFLDQLRFDGDLHAHLAGPTTGGGAGAMTLLLVAAPWAEAQLDAVRALLPPSAGASLLHSDLLVARLLAGDSFELRQSLVPILQRLCGALPKPWKI